jgi:hypothetical protein
MCAGVVLRGDPCRCCTVIGIVISIADEHRQNLAAQTGNIGRCCSMTNEI